MVEQKVEGQQEEAEEPEGESHGAPGEALEEVVLLELNREAPDEQLHDTQFPFHVAQPPEWNHLLNETVLRIRMAS